MSTLTRQQIQQLTTQQITQIDFTTISPLQITYFSGTQMASLSSNQVNSLSLAQIGNLNTGVTYSLLPLTSMTSVQLFDVSLNPNAYDHIWYMSKAGLLTYFSVVQIRTITVAQFQSIFPNQFSSFTALQMNAFQPFCYLKMSQSQMANCNANLGGLKAISTVGNGTPNLISGQTTGGSLVSYVNPDCFRTITGTQMTNYFKRTNSINYINTGIQENTSPSAVQQITGPQLSAFGCDVSGNIFNGGLDQGVYAIQTLFCFNLGYITSFSTVRTITIYDNDNNIITNPAQTVFKDVIGRFLLCPNYTNVPQISYLTCKQLQVFTMYQLHIITTVPSIYDNIQYNDAQIPYLSIDFIKCMPANRNCATVLTSYWKPSDDGTSQIYVTNGPVIYTSNINDLLPSQIAVLSMEQTQALSKVQIQSLNQSQVQAVNVKFLSPLQMTYFIIVQYNYFTQLQTAALTSLQLALLTDSFAIQQLRVSHLSLEYNYNVCSNDHPTGELCYPLAPSQIGCLVNNTSQIVPSQLPCFTQQQTQCLSIQYLTVSQIPYINVTQLSPLQISQLTINQVQALTLVQFQSLSKTQILSFTATQIQWLTSNEINIINSIIGGNISSYFTASEINQLTLSQLANFIIAVVSPSVFSGINPSQLQLLTSDQVGLITSAQLNIMTTAQWLAINIQQLSISSIQKMSAQGFSAIPPSIFGTLPVAVFGINFSTILLQAITSNTVSIYSTTIYGQAHFMTVQQVSALSSTNIGILSLTQIGSFTVDIQAIVLAIVNNQAGNLSINVASFNATVSAPYMDPGKVDATTRLDYNAIVSLTFPIQNAMDMFKYRYENNDTIRIYIDSTQFVTNYSYGSCNSVYLDPSLVDFSNNFSLQERLYIADTNQSIPVSYLGLNASPTQLSMIGPNNGLQWIGPVTSHSIPNETTIPISWDYILNIAKNIFNTWTAFSFFNNLYTTEKLLRQTINMCINAQIRNVLLPFDMNTVTTNPYILSRQMLIDSNNKAYSVLTNNPFNIVTNNNVGSLIYDYLFSKQPKRFVNQSDTTMPQGVSFPFPFISGDSINFTLTILPDINQHVIGNISLTILPRIYLIKMIIQ